MDEPTRLTLRGYRRVFTFERRLFRFDRWRIPYPHGVPLRGIGYFVLLEVLMLCCSRLPVAGDALALLNPAIVFLGVPLASAWLLMQVRIDGRPPHHVLRSLLAFWAQPRCLAGLAPCPEIGEVVVPLNDVTIAYDARESFVVRGKVKGPALVTCRYPSVCKVEGAPPWVRRREERRSRARRYRIKRRAGAPPMLRGRTIRVPRGRAVMFE